MEISNDFLRSAAKMRTAQRRERIAEGDDKCSVKEYANYFNQRYLAEKAFDEMLEKYLQNAEIQEQENS